ncbi:hypothetical protein [Scopulibacillus cellulosilyticus]|uniref:Uncharacterized protein n=1 Tax=Scopulibacillus cellulosilyticus TaxID=2665665 RepID=A0ABW2PYT6_9BACL
MDYHNPYQPHWNNRQGQGGTGGMSSGSSHNHGTFHEGGGGPQGGGHGEGGEPQGQGGFPSISMLPPPPFHGQGYPAQGRLTDTQYMVQMLTRLAMLVEQNNQLLRAFLQQEGQEKQRQIVTSGGGSVIVRM